jgi:hypothetical protein
MIETKGNFSSPFFDGINSGIPNQLFLKYNISTTYGTNKTVVINKKVMQKIEVVAEE